LGVGFHESSDLSFPFLSFSLLDTPNPPSLSHSQLYLIIPSQWHKLMSQNRCPQVVHPCKQTAETIIKPPTSQHLSDPLLQINVAQHPPQVQGKGLSRFHPKPTRPESMPCRSASHNVGNTEQPALYAHKSMQMSRAAARTLSTWYSMQEGTFSVPWCRGEVGCGVWGEALILFLVRCTTGWEKIHRSVAEGLRGDCWGVWDGLVTRWVTWEDVLEEVV
jgi:hypothetical protein